MCNSVPTKLKQLHHKPHEHFILCNSLIAKDTVFSGVVAQAYSLSSGEADQEDFEFKASLGYKERLGLKKKKPNKTTKTNKRSTANKTKTPDFKNHKENLNSPKCMYLKESQDGYPLE